VGTLTQPGDGANHELKSSCLVGRAIGSDLRLRSPGVSSRHATIRWEEGCWLLRDLGSRNGTTVHDRPVTAGEDVPLNEGALVRFGDDARGWVLTSASRPGPGPVEQSPTRLSDAELVFQVSGEDERCEFIIRLGLQVHDLGARTHHLALLTLARQRLDDVGRGDLLPAEQGWLHTDALARRLGLDVGALNVQLYRARKTLEKLDIEGAADLTERRPDTDQLRLGPSRLRITRPGDVP
jgi:pSer/pThr/pTyr-binding forkhead associated (FHA) protein